MSIIPSLLLFVGVVSSLSLHNNEEVDAYYQPIELQEARQICATLCMSGLGGKACGEKTCYDIEPDEFPTQSDDNSTASSKEYNRVVARRDVCPLLCEYELGEPLCNCTKPANIFSTVFHEVDFNKICGFFCLNHHYHITGCRACEIYQELQNLHETRAFSPNIFNLAAKQMHKKKNNQNIDWDEWCRGKCSEGDGGVACNCDILPLLI